MKVLESTFLRWWLFTIVTIVACVYVNSLGLFTSLWEIDKTKLSFVIIVIYLFESLYIGFNSYPGWPVDEKGIEAARFIPDVMSALGMIGTVIGFLIMLVTTFANLHIDNQQSVQLALNTMASGIGTALTTTLVGLICSLLTSIQLVNLRHGKAEL